jgi:hypothetical protein
MKFLSQINVNTEYTLPIVDGTNGQVLATDGSGTAYWGSISAGATNLDALTDVILTSPSSGQLLRYGIPPGSGEAQPVWYNFTPNYLTPSSSIDNLGDVTITSAASGQVLQWSGSAWVNATLTTAGYVSKVQHEVKAGVAITKGQAVYITGADGTNMIVGLASNATEATSSKTMGLALSSASVNGKFFVVTEGLIDGLNTQGANAGDAVWLGTGGNLIFGLTNKPVAPAHLVYLGVVTRVNQNNGEIFVHVQNGFELNELHDVLINGVSTGQLLRRDSDGLWKNWTPNYLTSLPVHNHDDLYYTENEIAAFFGGETPIAGYNQTNWDTAYGDKINSASFSTSTGVLTLTQQDAGTITVDLDGRYLESESDTLATVAARGNISNTKLQIRTAGNTSGGNLQLGPYSDGAAKWAYITAQHYNSSTEPEGFTLIGGLAQNGQNAVVIGGNIYESNPATEIQFWTHSSDTHSTGGTQRGIINSSGNWGVGTTSPANKLHVVASGSNASALIIQDDARRLQLGRDQIEARTANGLSVENLYIQPNGTTALASTSGNVGIGRSNPSYKLDVAGSVRFDNELYVGGVWSSSYGPRDSNGNINFVDWSSNVIARINRVSGIASVGNRKLSMGILDINSQGTPEIRINTKIPFALGAADFTVNIKGFQYGGTNMMSLSIGWHYYLSQFYNETAISNGAFAPNITLAVDESNMVVIHLSNVGYWPKLYVESVYSSAYADDYVANWNWTDAGVDALSSITPVTYKPLDTSVTGNAAYASSAGNSSTTSQTNFSTLTVSNNTVATQAWVQAQGYASSFSETDTLATVTARGSSTNTFTSLLGGSKLVIQNASNGGSGRGIFMWSSDDSNWGIYMSTAAAGVSLAGGNAVSSIDGRTSHHIRFRVFNNVGNGFIWENSSEVALMSLNANTGSLYTRGEIYAGNNTSNLVWHAGNLNPAGFVATSGAEFTGPVIVNVGDVAVDTMAFKVAGPSDYDSLTIGMRGTPDYDSYIASFGNDIHFYSGKGVTTENHSFFWYTSKSGSQQHGVVAMTLDHLQNLTIGGTYTENSSIRYKDNITPLESVSGKVEKLEAVTYTKKGDELVQLGLIAESVSELFPEIVKYDEEGRPDGVSYTRLSVILLKALQEQNAVIAALTERVNKLENK